MIFMYLLVPFIDENFFKNHWSGSRVMRMHNFWTQNSQVAQKKRFFLKKTINNTILMYLLACFIVQNVKKNC